MSSLCHLEEQRAGEAHCVVEWSDTRKLEIIPQSSIRVSPSESIQINSTYTIVLNGKKRYGTVLAKGRFSKRSYTHENRSIHFILGTKNQCEAALDRLSPSSASPASGSGNDLINDMLIMRILTKLLQNGIKRADEQRAEDEHDVQCAACQMKPIVNRDRYRCLECSTSSSGYDLCGVCFEKRRQTDRHQSGHAMIHFRLPREFLGISIDTIDQELNLQQVRRLSTLINEKHEGTTCDGECGRKDFIGLRFKCDVCPQYDLCERCAIDRRVVTKNHQTNHPIILSSARVIPKISLKDIEMGDVLGRGSFGASSLNCSIHADRVHLCFRVCLSWKMDFEESSGRCESHRSCTEFEILR